MGRGVGTTTNLESSSGGSLGDGPETTRKSRLGIRRRTVEPVCVGWSDGHHPSVIGTENTIVYSLKCTGS